MDWGGLEADILHVQCLMKNSKFHESNEVVKNCVEAFLKNTTILTPNIKMLSNNCLLIHSAMSLLYNEEFEESLKVFELLNVRQVFNCALYLNGTGSGFQEVWDMSRDALLHANLNASVAAEKCGMSQLTQSYLEKAIQLYREQALSRHEGVTWHRLGKLLGRQNKQTQAGLSLNTACLLFKKCQLPVLEAESLCDLAAVYWATNNTSRISEVMERTHFICLSLTNQPDDQRHLYNRLASLYSEQRAYPDAALCLEHVIASSGSGGERARNLVRRGQVLRWMGERPKWERAMRGAREECEVLDSAREASEVLISIAQEWSELGLYRETQEHLERAVQVSGKCKSAELVMTGALEDLGDVLIKQRRRTDAVERYKEAYLLLEKLYDESGKESVGMRLQRVWSKYISSRGVETRVTGDNTLMVDSNSLCEGSFTVITDREEVSQTEEVDTQSLVSVSDLSDLSCNETILANDPSPNRSLTKGDTDATQLEGNITVVSASPSVDTLLPSIQLTTVETTVKTTRQKLRKRVQSKITHSFRSNKITPLSEESSDAPKEIGLATGPPSSTEVSISRQDSDNQETANKPATSRTCSLL